MLSPRPTFQTAHPKKQGDPMAGRSRSTFGKRQKEMKRLEKRQDKAARKDQRKQEKASGAVAETDLLPGDESPGSDGQDEDSDPQAPEDAPH
jgi:hypothetical protein